MAWYIWETCDKKKRLTLQNMGGLLKYNIIPNETEEIAMGKRIYEFTRYLKSICKNDKITFKLDERAINFLSEISSDDLIFQKNNEFHMKCKEWDNVYLVVMAKYAHNEEREEDYIDLIPILSISLITF